MTDPRSLSAHERHMMRPAGLTRRRAIASLAAGLLGLGGTIRAALALPPNPIRVTGGRWLLDSVTQAKVTFGFQLRLLPPSPILPLNPIKGTFELHNHLTGFRLHTTEFLTLEAIEGSAQFSGPMPLGLGTEGPSTFSVQVLEGTSASQPYFSIVSNAITVAGFLGGGSITVESQAPTLTD